jgi:pimeloyl-ACP methyl ester carboxylesterase
MPRPPVLLVHGFASSYERNWVQPGWAELLADEGRRVIGVDLLGHGEAAKPHDPACYADLEGGVEAALPPDGQVDAIGFSLGARVLLTLASRSPSRFRRIVAGGVGANLLSERAGSEEVALAIEGRNEVEDVLGRAFARFARDPGNDPVALAACLRRPERPFRAEELAKITAPVLVVLGEEDFAGPGEPLARALPDAELVLLPGVDHLGTPESFGFIDAALAFVRAD